MDKTEPLFKSIFGQQWDTLPEALRMRYANRPNSNDIVSAEGKLDIYFSPRMTFLIPIFRMLKIFAPYQGKNIPVKVNFRSDPHSSRLYFERTFYFPGKKPYSFCSYQQPTKDTDVIEFSYFGLGWRMKCSFDGEKILLQHKGFVWKIFGLFIPIPLGFLIGIMYAEEQAISNDSFRMLMTITHPLFGKLFEYGGEFKLVSTQGLTYDESD